MKPPACAPLDWTPWLNSDTPFSGCDVETLPRLWQKFPDVVCQHPSAIDVREVASGDRYVPASNIEVDIERGFKCCSRFGKTCSDYEVRFCCPKGKQQISNHIEQNTQLIEEVRCEEQQSPSIYVINDLF